MDKVNIEQINKSALKIISNEKGDIFHALKKTEKDFHDFGEIYFSRINHNSIKGWKKHTRMTMNLVVPYGKVQFVFFDSFGNVLEETVGEGNYVRLNVPPGLWFGFRGIFKPFSLVANIANKIHDPNEAIRVSLDHFNYEWNTI